MKHAHRKTSAIAKGRTALKKLKKKAHMPRQISLGRYHVKAVPAILLTVGLGTISGLAAWYKHKK